MSEQTYIERRDGGYWVAGTRVSLDSLVVAFLSGQTAESIARSFDTLSLEQVYGAITFYLANRQDIDAYLAQSRKEFDRQYQAARAADPELYKRIEEARLRRTA
ncbi:MAG: DUF433 domain-containing protein [Acidobacteriota bacterium]